MNSFLMLIRIKQLVLKEYRGLNSEQMLLVQYLEESNDVFCSFFSEILQEAFNLVEEV